MAALFDAHGFRIFTPHQKRMVDSTQRQPVREKVGIKKMSIGTMVRHYERLLGIIKTVLASDPKHRIFRDLIQDCANLPTIAEFQSLVEELLVNLKNDPRLSTLAENIGFPFFMPRSAIKHYGRSIDKLFLPLLRASFDQHMSGQDRDYCVDMTFENDLRVRQQHSPLHFNAQSRYNDLIHATGTRYVVGIFFPALPGFSTYACLEQMATLPKGFILSGIATTAMAMAMWPQHLKHFNFLCPATHYELPTRSISFESGGETTTVIQPTESGIFATGLVRFCSGLIYIGDQH